MNRRQQIASDVAFHFPRRTTGSGNLLKIPQNGTFPSNVVLGSAHCATFGGQSSSGSLYTTHNLKLSSKTSWEIPEFNQQEAHELISSQCSVLR